MFPFFPLPLSIYINIYWIYINKKQGVVNPEMLISVSGGSAPINMLKIKITAKKQKRQLYKRTVNQSF